MQTTDDRSTERTTDSRWMAAFVVAAVVFLGTFVGAVLERGVGWPFVVLLPANLLFAFWVLGGLWRRARR